MIELAGLRMPNPLLVAAGCGGTGRELTPYLGPDGLAGLGGFVTRSITLDPRPGDARPRVVEAASGILHAAGLPNPGLDVFLATELPWLVREATRVVVSIAGSSIGEYAELARRLGHAPGVWAVEVNVSDPGSLTEPFQGAAVVAAVQRNLPRGIPVLAKLRPDALRVVEAARTALESGAAAVVVANAQPGALPDGRPAGLSGPGSRPLALRCVIEVRQALPEAQVVGCGGIATVADARSFLDAGAVAVQVGTALLHDPTAAARLAAELTEETVS